MSPARRLCPETTAASSPAAAAARFTIRPMLWPVSALAPTFPCRSMERKRGPLLMPAASIHALHARTGQVAGCPKARASPSPCPPDPSSSGESSLRAPWRRTPDPQPGARRARIDGSPWRSRGAGSPGPWYPPTRREAQPRCAAGRRGGAGPPDAARCHGCGGCPPEPLALRRWPWGRGTRRRCGRRRWRQGLDQMEPGLMPASALAVA